MKALAKEAAAAEAPVDAVEDDELAPDDESRTERFHRVGNRRMSRLLKEFELLENLASPNYEFSKEEFERMFDALETNVARLKDKFAKRLQREAKTKPTFTF